MNNLLMTTLFSKQKGISLLELSIVLLIISICVGGIIFGSKKVLDSSNYSNSLRSSATLDIFDNDALVLWLETSQISKSYENNDVLNFWVDNSKNSITFSGINFPHLVDTNGLKSVYFDGNSYFESSTPLNLSSYTIFIVADISKEDNDGVILESGFKIKSNEISGKIIVFKNVNNIKYVKTPITDFIQINNIDNLDISPENMKIGENVTGKIFEIIVFDGELNDFDVLKITNYLQNKYKRII